ncbi:hypothetical protein S2L_16 [Cyanophage S-2L]|nr:hypothetical protein S2L_16 [Cyanophage S-2L]
MLQVQVVAPGLQVLDRDGAREERRHRLGDGAHERVYDHLHRALRLAALAASARAAAASAWRRRHLAASDSYPGRRISASVSRYPGGSGSPALARISVQSCIGLLAQRLLGHGGIPGDVVPGVVLLGQARDQAANLGGDLVQGLGLNRAQHVESLGAAHGTLDPLGEGPLLPGWAVLGAPLVEGPFEGIRHCGWHSAVLW